MHQDAADMGHDHRSGHSVDHMMMSMVVRRHNMLHVLPIANV